MEMLPTRAVKTQARRAFQSRIYTSINNITDPDTGMEQATGGFF
jgi:hypothetical protein